MREFRLAFPQFDESGILRSDIRDNLASSVARAYGNVLISDSIGAYRGSDGQPVAESMYVLDSATDSGAEDVLAFARMAVAEIRAALGHRPVYFRNVDGFATHL